MLDFPIQEPSVGTAIFAFISYLLILKKGFSKSMNEGIQRFTFSSGTLVFLAVLMAIHTINGDFFHLFFGFKQLVIDHVTSLLPAYLL